MSIPVLTTEQRKAAADKAVAARRKRAEFKAEINAGRINASQALGDKYRKDDVIGRMNGKDAEVVTKVILKGNDVEIGTLTVKTTTGDPLPTLATGNNVRIAPMIINADLDNPNDPLNKYVESLGDNAMTTMMLLMQKLPMSVLMLVMQ